MTRTPLEAVSDLLLLCYKENLTMLLAYCPEIQKCGTSSFIYICAVPVNEMESPALLRFMTAHDEHSEERNDLLYVRITAKQIILE